MECVPKNDTPSFSSTLPFRCSNTDEGMLKSYFSRIAKASETFDVAGIVGPEATRDGSSPGTSEIINVWRRAGIQDWPRRPPFTADRCLRTVFISEIGAPHLTNISFTFCLSLNAMLSAGKVRSADPPPEIKHNTKSSSVRSSRYPSILPAAFKPASSGIG